MLHRKKWGRCVRAAIAIARMGLLFRLHLAEGVLVTDEFQNEAEGGCGRTCHPAVFGFQDGR